MARILRNYPCVALNIADFNGEIDFARVFGRFGALHIEIGSGKGTFLINQGRAEPAVNFLGIERAGKYYRYAVDRIGRWGLTNVRITCTDAAEFLANFVPGACVDCFHIYFPDPWPKRRHHKRRFFCTGNVRQLLRCLKRGGIIQAATDYGEYFEQIKALLAAQESQVEEIEFILPAGAERGEWVGTNFERKYLKEQRAIYTIAVRKI